MESGPVGSRSRLGSLRKTDGEFTGTLAYAAMVPAFPYDAAAALPGFVGSTRVTRRPSRCRCSALASPTNPPPTTTDLRACMLYARLRGSRRRLRGSRRYATSWGSLGRVRDPDRRSARSREGCDSRTAERAKARQHDIMRGLFKDSGSLSVDKFVQRAQQLSNVRQLELMGDGAHSPHTPVVYGRGHDLALGTGALDISSRRGLFSYTACIYRVKMIRPPAHRGARARARPRPGARARAALSRLRLSRRDRYIPSALTRAAGGVRFDVSSLSHISRTTDAHTESPVRDTIFGIKTHGSDTRIVVSRPRSLSPIVGRTRGRPHVGHSTSSGGC